MAGPTPLQSASAVQGRQVLVAVSQMGFVPLHFVLSRHSTQDCVALLQALFVASAVHSVPAPMHSTHFWAAGSHTGFFASVQCFFESVHWTQAAPPSFLPHAGVPASA